MFNGYALVKLLSVAVSAFSQILLKKSAMQQHESGLKEYLNPLVIIAYVLFFGSAVVGVYALKGITISFSTIIESLSYIMVPVLSFLFLREKMNKKQLIGMAIILIGVILFEL